MASDQDREITSGTGGNTAGTGGPNHGSPSGGAGVGAAGRQPLEEDSGDGRQSEESKRSGALGGGSNEEGAGQEDLAHADRRVAQAVEGGGNAAAPGPRGGKLSSEGTGGAEAGGQAGGGAPSGGDIGGMGGAGSAAANPDHRPNGGSSPVGSGSADRH